MFFFTSFATSNPQNIIFSRKSRSGAPILYCRRLHSTVCTHYRTGVRRLCGRLGELGGVAEHRKRAGESCNVGDRSQFPTNKPLGTIAERHGAIPMLWRQMEPRKSRIRPPDPSLGRLPAALPSTIPSTSVETQQRRPDQGPRLVLTASFGNIFGKFLLCKK